MTCRTLRPASRRALQAGEPDEDVLLMMPRDAWDAAGSWSSRTRVPAFEEAGLLLWRRGFAWDAVSERRLAEARAEDGAPRRRPSSGARHPAPAAVQRLAALAREGATRALSGRPADVPGWNARSPA